METQNALTVLYRDHNQSPWLDNLGREQLRDGSLRRWMEMGIRGVTSNPTIFQKAIAGSNLYDSDLIASITSGKNVEEAFWDLACADVAQAADLFRPIFDDAAGADGHVSIEVSPALAYDTNQTVTAAVDLWQRLGRQNVMIKIPATSEGIEAFRRVVALGINVNVTLIFSLPVYERVLDAYLTGLEELAQRDPEALRRVCSVASFFISRVDTEIDSRLSRIGYDRARVLLGQGALAQARLAYHHFQQVMRSSRWLDLASLGARPQRPLWASTSTKNDRYPDTMYVDGLIGPQSVNTLPESTAKAFLDHGTNARTVDQDIDRSHHVWAEIAAVGVDLVDVAVELERQGVGAFVQSFEDLLNGLSDKISHLT